jgi:hypothetical protein
MPVTFDFLNMLLTLAAKISSLEHTLIAKREIMNRVEQREHARKVLHFLYDNLSTSF